MNLVLKDNNIEELELLKPSLNDQILKSCCHCFHIPFSNYTWEGKNWKRILYTDETNISGKELDNLLSFKILLPNKYLQLLWLWDYLNFDEANRTVSLRKKKSKFFWCVDATEGLSPELINNTTLNQDFTVFRFFETDQIKEAFEIFTTVLRGNYIKDHCAKMILEYANYSKVSVSVNQTIRVVFDSRRITAYILKMSRIIK